MDKLVSKIVGLGIPGLILLVAISASGLAGGAAIVTALATLGGPLGMIGGIGLLGILALIADGIGKYGFDAVFVEVVKKLREKGKSKEDIEKEIQKYPISKSLKRKLKEELERLA